MNVIVRNWHYDLIFQPKCQSESFKTFWRLLLVLVPSTFSDAISSANKYKVILFKKRKIMMKWSVKNKHKSKCLAIRKKKEIVPLPKKIFPIYFYLSAIWSLLGSMWWLLTQIICLQRVDLLKKRQDLLTNQSVSGGHIYLLPTKSAVSAVGANLTIFLDDFFS